VEVLLVLEARLAEVHLRVDAARQHEHAARVELGTAVRRLHAAAELLHAPGEDQHVLLGDTRGGDDATVPQAEVAAGDARGHASTSSGSGGCLRPSHSPRPTKNAPTRIIAAQSVWPIVMPSSTVPI